MSHQRYVLRGQHARGSCEVSRSLVVLFDELAFSILRVSIRDKISLKNEYELTIVRWYTRNNLTSSQQDVFATGL
jgi:hypothetical protein